eukprot:746193-Hanusia_phi.AAC.4
MKGSAGRGPDLILAGTARAGAGRAAARRTSDDHHAACRHHRPTVARSPGGRRAASRLSLEVLQAQHAATAEQMLPYHPGPPNGDSDPLSGHMIQAAAPQKTAALAASE